MRLFIVRIGASLGVDHALATERFRFVKVDAQQLKVVWRPGNRVHVETTSTIGSHGGIERH